MQGVSVTSSHDFERKFEEENIVNIYLPHGLSSLDFRKINNLLYFTIFIRDFEKFSRALVWFKSHQLKHGSCRFTYWYSLYIKINSDFKHFLHFSHIFYLVSANIGFLSFYYVETLLGKNYQDTPGLLLLPCFPIDLALTKSLCISLLNFNKLRKLNRLRIFRKQTICFTDEHTAE